MAATLGTERLLLRAWRDEDFSPFAALNADPRVMEFYPRPLTQAESNKLAAGIRTRLDHSPFGLSAVELRETGAFLGYVGLAVPTFDAYFTPCVEIAWRLAFEYWRKGYATEAAQAVKNHAFDHLELAELVAFTSVRNLRSQRVMERLGMRHDPAEDFDHPGLPAHHPLARHVLFRLSPERA